jgi:tRNA threonylcarbamoyladenosine biosynthesis protein TsaE
MIELPAQLVSPSPAATIAWGRELAAGLPDFALLLLVGELGAGKTTLMKGLAAGWGVAEEDEVASPTYTLVHEYRRGGRALYHLDLYRVAGAAELATLGLDDVLAPPPPGEAKLVAIEWGERLGGRLPKPCLRIELAAVAGAPAGTEGEEARRIAAGWLR